jgi:hypothetical protein
MVKSLIRLSQIPPFCLLPFAFCLREALYVCGRLLPSRRNLITIFSINFYEVFDQEQLLLFLKRQMKLIQVFHILSDKNYTLSVFRCLAQFLLD